MEERHTGVSRAEQTLVNRFREGDEKAFDEIFETYSPPLLGFLTRMCGDPDDARETLQDTFLNIYRYLHGFRGESSLKNWLFKVAVTACLKKKRRRTSLHGGPAEEVACSEEDFPFTWPPCPVDMASPEWQKDPEELYLDKEFRQAMIRGISAMPYKYKIVINLRDFEGFSTEEVSRLLDIKPSTVKVRLHRARLYLQEWMRRQYRL